MEAAKKAKKGETDTETEDDTEKPDTSKASSYYGVVVCNPDESGAFTAYNLHVKVMFQNGKIIGAVTHVFVNDPAKGYAILMETMLYEMEK